MGLLDGLLSMFGGGQQQQGLLSQGQGGMPPQGQMQNPMQGLLQGQPQQPRPDFMQSLSRALMAAGQPSKYKMTNSQALLQGLSAGVNGNPEQAEMQAMLNNPDENAIKNRYMLAQMQASMKPDYKSVKSGEKLIDPATGKTIFDGGPETMTPYQNAMLNISERRLNMSNNANNGMGKPPTGYRWTPDGKSFEAIPGGPATKLTPEGAAKNAQIDNAISTLPEIKRLMVDQTPNAAGFYAMAGDTGQGRRLVKQAVEGYLRATSGAAVPEPEVTRALELYEPKPYDKKETRARKVQQLEKFLTGAGANMKKGRTLADDMPQPQDNPVANMSDDDLLKALGGM